MESRCPYVLDTSGLDVHAEADQLRSLGPIVPVELPGGIQGWSVTTYAAAQQVINDRRFSKDAKHWPALQNGEIPSDWPMITWAVMDNMTTAEGADHERLRALISKGFTARRIESARPLIEKITNELLDDLAALPEGEVIDLKSLFCYPVPARVVCDLFGVPAEGREAALRGGEVNVNSNITPEEAEANLLQWHQAMLDLADLKRTTPGDDLTSLLVAAQDGDNALSQEEMAGTLHLMLGAGSETLMNVLSHAVRAMLTHPDQLAMVRNGDATWDEVFDETIRVDSPAAQLPFRFATEDVELCGVRIEKGAPVLMGFAAIGRDPALHGSTRNEFDVKRADKTNMSFGHGIHFCLGAPLARLEAAIVLPALFARFPELEMAVAPEDLLPQGTFIMNGHASLPVRLGKAAPQTYSPVDATGSTMAATSADMERVSEGTLGAVVETVTSADGTTIAYERSGSGPPVVIIGGGLNEKAMFTTLAELLSEEFTVYNCDRRGRGDSGEGDRESYTIDREVEDLAAVLGAAGPTASVFANCTGGYIAIKAAARGVPMAKLALYEPPYGAPSLPADDFVDRLKRLIAEDRREDAITVFWRESVGFSDELIAQFKEHPAWERFLAIAPSIVYDAIIDRDDGEVPYDELSRVGVPTLMIVGSDTSDWIKKTCDIVVEEIPDARKVILDGAGHLFSQASAAPLLAEFLGGSVATS